MTTEWPIRDEWPIRHDASTQVAAGREAASRPAPDGEAADVHSDGAADDDTDGEDETHRSAVDAVDALLDGVERALARLDDGSYGRCETCGEPIADERLHDDPIARRCAACGGAGRATTGSGADRHEVPLGAVEGVPDS